MWPMPLAQITLIYRCGEIVRSLPLVSGTRNYIIPTEDAECIGIIGRGEKMDSRLRHSVLRTALRASVVALRAPRCELPALPLEGT